jgi:hypothetical protein
VRQLEPSFEDYPAIHSSCQYLDNELPPCAFSADRKKANDTRRNRYITPALWYILLLVVQLACDKFFHDNMSGLLLLLLSFPLFYVWYQLACTYGGWDSEIRCGGKRATITNSSSEQQNKRHRKDDLGRGNDESGDKHPHDINGPSKPQGQQPRRIPCPLSTKTGLSKTKCDKTFSSLEDSK